MLRANHRPPSILGDDPFSHALKPSPYESDYEKHARLEREIEAKRISDLIDDEIRRDKERYKRSKQDVRLLLLGQAESGKSTLQKQFQLLHSPASLDAERASWKIVIFYNVIHAIRTILDGLELWGHLVYQNLNQPRANSSEEGDPYTPGGRSSITQLRLRLTALVAVEQVLADRLSGGLNITGGGKDGVYVRSGWQVTAQVHLARSKGKGKARSTGNTPDDVDPDDLLADVARKLQIARDDIVSLRHHQAVTKLLEKKKIRMEEWSEFFLDQINRIAERGYVPTIDDVLHARIQTIGVAEHTFVVQHNNRQVQWRLYDVGGARGQRHTWAPFFDDANAIIYVAPISAYDQYLEEDPLTNRIEDSIQLFSQICANKLLKNVHLVLFLNKTDLLKKKLAQGTRVSKYITSYGKRSNEYEPVSNYFKTHFVQVHRSNNPGQRVLYVHMTSVVDTKATQTVIINVRDSIFRGYLKDAALV